MANLNKVMFIGRLTRDVETRMFANGGKVAKLGFAVTNRKKNRASGKWEDEPLFLDAELYNGNGGKQLADIAEQHLSKGSQIFLEGSLEMDSWEKDGQKRTKMKVRGTDFQFVDGKKKQENDGGDVDNADASNPTDKVNDDDIPF